jgi:hypothetical protein
MEMLCLAVCTWALAAAERKHNSKKENRMICMIKAVWFGALVLTPSLLSSSPIVGMQNRQTGHSCAVSKLMHSAMQVKLFL